MTDWRTCYIARWMYRVYSSAHKYRGLLAEHMTHLLKILFARPMVLIGMGGFVGGTLRFHGSQLWIWVMYIFAFAFLIVWLFIVEKDKAVIRQRIIILGMSMILGFYCMFYIQFEEEKAWHTLRSMAVETQENQTDAASEEGGVMDENGGLNENGDVDENSYLHAAYDGTYEGYIVSVSLPGDDYKSYVMINKNRVRICFGSAKKELAYGQHIRVTGSMSLVPPARNPGGFDRSGYFARQGIYINISTYDQNIFILDDSKMEPSLYVRLQFLGLSFRSHVSSLWMKVLGTEDGALLSGMIMGDTSGMSKDLKRAFYMCNLSHLTAVSGANVAFFLMPMTALFQRMSGRRGVRSLLIFIFLIFFGFITGWSASVTRALFMSMGTIVSALLMKRHDPVSAMFLTATILLMNNPYTAVDYGFLLSFCATLSLILFMDRMTARLHFLPGGRILQQPVACVLCTQIGMLPWLVALSGKQSILLFLTNIAGSFLSEGISILALPLSACLFIAQLVPVFFPLLKIMYLPLAGLLYLLRQMAYASANQSIQALRLHDLQPFLIFSVIVLSVSLLLEKSFVSRNIRRMTCVFVCFGIILQCSAYLNRPTATIVFIDVGQGDSILIMLDNHKSILIDGGDRGSGEQILIPLLNYFGIDQPDITILTHLHQDHGAGIIELIKEGRIESVFTPCITENLELSELFKQADSKSIRLHSLRKNDKMILSEYAVLYVLSPEAITEDGGNEDSAVILLVINRTGILLMGDSGNATEAKLISDTDIRSLIGNRVDILKVGHHGSKFATTEAFLSVLDLQATMISVGDNNYGHPTQETLDRLAAEQTALYRTDQSGAIIVDIRRETFEVHEYIAN